MGATAGGAAAEDKRKLIMMKRFGVGLTTASMLAMGAVTLKATEQNKDIVDTAVAA